MTKQMARMLREAESIEGAADKNRKHRKRKVKGRTKKKAAKRGK